jgi:hypothetical protein
MSLDCHEDFRSVSPSSSVRAIENLRGGVTRLLRKNATVVWTVSVTAAIVALVGGLLPRCGVGRPPETVSTLLDRLLQDLNRTHPDAAVIQRTKGDLHGTGTESHVFVLRDVRQFPPLASDELVIYDKKTGGIEPAFEFRPPPITIGIGLRLTDPLELIDMDGNGSNEVIASYFYREDGNFLHYPVVVSWYRDEYIVQPVVSTVSAKLLERMETIMPEIPRVKLGLNLTTGSRISYPVVAFDVARIPIFRGLKETFNGIIVGLPVEERLGDFVIRAEAWIAWPEGYPRLEQCLRHAEITSDSLPTAEQSPLGMRIVVSWLQDAKTCFD